PRRARPPGAVRRPRPSRAGPVRTALSASWLLPPRLHRTREVGVSCATGSGHGPAVVRSLVPARMDRLPWSPFHTRLVVALGVTWVLDGLEITLASLIGPVLQSERTLHLTSVQIGTTASVYLVGEVAGALFFGHLADRLGRRRLFLATLALYLTANGLTALSFGYASLLVFRFLAGAGIGGEY